MGTPHPTSRRRGFTLIELLVVVSVIALLLGIMLPTLRAAQNAARRTRCLANLRGVGIGVQVYLNENRHILPYALPLDDSSVYGGEPLPPEEVNPDGILATFGPLMDSTEVLICPSDDSIPHDLMPERLYIGRHSSYEYWAGVLMVSREVFRDDTSPERAVSKFYEFNNEFPVFADSAARHPGGPEFDQNALYYGDFRADWLRLDPSENVAGAAR